MPNLNIQAIISAKNQAASALSSFRGGLLDVATVLAPIAAGLAAVSVAVSKVTTAAAEQERADVKLAGALASIGRNTPEVRAELSAFVSELENTTEAQDDAIQGALATLTAFGRLEGEGLKRATKAALDYAAATGGEVSETATQLANVIAKGQGRLKGIATDFAEGTSKAERFEMVLAQIEGKVGGRAAVDMRTFSGAVGLIGKQFSNFLEAVGQAIVKSEAFRVVLRFLAETFAKWAKVIEAHPEMLLDLVEGFLSAAIGVAEFAASIAAAAGKLKILFLATSAVTGNLSSMVALWKEFTSDEASVSDRISEGGKKAQDALASLRAEFEASRGKLRDVAGEVKNVSGGLDDLSGEVSQLERDLKELGIEGFDAAAKKGAALDRVTEELERQFTAGEIPVERYKAIRKELGQMAEKLTEAGVALKDWTVVIADDAETALESLGVNIGEIIKQAAAFPEATADLQAFAEAGVIGAVQFEVQMAGLLNLADQMRLAGIAIETGLTKAEEMAIQVGSAIKDWGIDTALKFGDTLVDAAMAGKAAFADFGRAVLADLLKILLRMAIIKLIAVALGAIGGGPAGAAAAAATNGITIAGGMVGAASGGVVRGGISGRDSVAALLTPGEVVLPASLTEQFADVAAFARLATSGGMAGGAAAATSPVHLTLNFGRQNRDSEIADLIRDITRAVERHGHRLLASEVSS